MRRGDVFSQFFSSDSDKCLHFWYYVRRVTPATIFLRLYVNREGTRRALFFHSVSSGNQWLHQQMTLKKRDGNIPFKVGIFE